MMLYYNRLIKEGTLHIHTAGRGDKSWLDIWTPSFITAIVRRKTPQMDTCGVLKFVKQLWTLVIPSQYISLLFTGEVIHHNLVQGKLLGANHTASSLRCYTQVCLKFTVTCLSRVSTFKTLSSTEFSNFACESVSLIHIIIVTTFISQIWLGSV